MEPGLAYVEPEVES